ERSRKRFVEQRVGKRPAVSDEHVNTNRGKDSVGCDSAAMQDIAENRDREESNQNDDAAMRDQHSPMLLENEKQRRRDDRDYRQDDCDDEKVPAFAECVRSSHENRRCNDIENQNPVPKCDGKRAESEDYEDENKQRQVSPGIFVRCHCITRLKQASARVVLDVDLMKNSAIRARAPCLLQSAEPPVSQI